MVLTVNDVGRYSKSVEIVNDRNGRCPEVIRDLAERGAVGDGYVAAREQ
jgi:hypothetical protein